MASFFCLIPMEPTPKGRPQFSRKMGIAFTPAKTRSAEAETRWHIEKAIQKSLVVDSNKLPFDGPLIVSISFKCSRPKSVRRVFHTTKPDLDNMTKLVLDSCNKRVFEDDGQIYDLHVRKEYTSGTPMIQIHVMELIKADQNKMAKENRDGKK